MRYVFIVALLFVSFYYDATRIVNLRIPDNDNRFDFFPVLFARFVSLVRVHAARQGRAETDPGPRH
jgi:hypothetical protein